MFYCWVALWVDTFVIVMTFCLGRNVRNDNDGVWAYEVTDVGYDTAFYKARKIDDFDVTVFQIY